MIYFLRYTPKNAPNSWGAVLFDIEYFVKQSEIKKEDFYSEIKCFPCVEGLTIFLKDRFEEKSFDYLDFIKEANEIQEVRGLLFESERNTLKPREQAYEFHNYFRGVIEQMFNDFCKKWGLWIDVD